jgi:hypothetical protein
MNQVLSEPARSVPISYQHSAGTHFFSRIVYSVTWLTFHFQLLRGLVLSVTPSSPLTLWLTQLTDQYVEV